jgi:alkylation response protein AidB-like acyl-CoA dehydrogenase
MDFEYPLDVVEWRKEFGSYLDSVVTHELRDEMESTGGETTGPKTKEFWRRLGKDGYFGLGWPVEYGGGGKSLWYLHSFNYEMMYRRLSVPVVTLNTVGPTLMRIGSEEQKKEYLPRILSAEIEFAIGYSEPGAGTDLASLQTKAVRDGDNYVINGQKVFTSGAHHSDYVWLAVRTDSEAPKHRGISILICPLDAEGVEIRPFRTMGGYRTNITFYDNVRVPLNSLVGEENAGWHYITTQLDFERIAISPIPHIERVFDSLCDLFRREGLGVDEGWTAAKLVEMAADLNTLKVMDLKMASMIQDGEVPYYEASLLKVQSSELQVRLLNDALQMLGASGLIKRGSPGERLNGQIERALKSSLVLIFGGGSNDVQRDIMATHGLGLAR